VFSSVFDCWNPKPQPPKQEKARVEAVRKAESLLTDDDDVVVSDIDDEDEDDGIV